MRISLLPVLAALLFAQTLFAQGKISQKLREDFQKSGGHDQDMIVILSAQADVSDAVNIPDWDARGEYVFRTLSSLAAATQGNVLNICRAFGGEPQPLWIVNIVSVKGSPALADALAALPEVREVIHSSNFFMEKPVEPIDDSIIETTLRNAVTYTWGVQKIKADSVWMQGFRGTGIVVGGADTGYEWDHPALKNAYRGWDGTAEDHDYNWHDAIHTRHAHWTTDNTICPYNMATPCDDNGHGTHTAGTMVGKDSTDPGNVQYIGVAPDAKWIGCRNMDRGWGTPITYSECFQWFLAPTKINGTAPDPTKRPHVINNSWGCPIDEGCNTMIGSTHWIIRTSLINLRNAGTVCVVSAGNSGPNCHTIQDPAAMYEAAYSIGASTSTDGIASFSSRGKVSVDTSFRQKPQIVAPGVGVLSSYLSATYATLQGTSMAGPHVAGAVALLLDAVPGYIGNVALIEARLNGGAKSLPGASTLICDGIPTTTIPNPVWGYGRLDIKKSVLLAQTLPVELVSFIGKLEKSRALLFWETATEVNNSHFLIEKSTDGIHWNNIGRVAGNGTTAEPKSYQFIDNQPVAGMNYYRLQQVDFDGTAERSPIVAVAFYQNNTVRAYPNPAADALTLAIFSVKSTDATLEILDANGRLVRQMPMPLVHGSLTFETNIAELASGVYFMRLLENGGGLLGEGKFVKD